MRLEKMATAPKATKTAGNEQQIKVEDDANKEKKFEVLSFMLVVKLFKPSIPVCLKHFDH